jgi:hypothetical protein
MKNLKFRNMNWDFVVCYKVAGIHYDQCGCGIDIYLELCAWSLNIGFILLTVANGTACLLVVAYFAYPWNLNMKVMYFPGTSVDFYQITWFYEPDDGALHSWSCNDLKSSNVRQYVISCRENQFSCSRASFIRTDGWTERSYKVLLRVSIRV